MPPAEPILTELQARWGAETIRPQVTADGVPTAWVPQASILEVLAALRDEVDAPYRTLYDLTAVDERARRAAVASRDDRVARRELPAVVVPARERIPDAGGGLAQALLVGCVRCMSERSR